MDYLLKSVKETQTFIANLKAELMLDLPGVDADSAASELHFCAQRLEDLRHELYIAQVGYIVDDAGFVGEERGGHERERGVFRTADLHFAAQRHTAFDE